MQMMADITGMPIRIHRSEQTCALGAAMFAATASGIHHRVEDAMVQMGTGFEKTYFPEKKKQQLYEERFLKYTRIGNAIEKLTI